MKLAAITDEISQDFGHALAVMDEYGIRGAELRGLWGTNIADLGPDEVGRAKSALSSHGMSVVCLATPLYKCDLELNEGAATAAGPMHLAQARPISAQIELLRRCAGLAHDFGTDLLRVFAFWRKSELSPVVEERIAEALLRAADAAAEEGVTLVLENEHACMIGTGAELARIVSRVDSPNLRACWDPGNALYAGEHPFPEGYEEVRPLLRHMHVKDAVLGPDGRTPSWCVVGEGVIGYREHFEALKRDGYMGWLSLETHYIPDGEEPEAGSRACLAALRRLLPAENE